MNKKIRNFLIIIFMPAIILWSIFGYYDFVIYGRNKTNKKFEESIKELKEMIKNDIERDTEKNIQ
jgi:hypothetical protein